MPGAGNWFRRLRWPPRGLGLGTPANLAAFSPVHRPGLARLLPLSFLAGIATALLMLGVDQLLFAGISVERVRTVGELPFGDRILISVFAGVFEELVFRLGWATLAAALVYLSLRRFTRHAATIGIWVGILFACVLFGLAHVGNLPHVPHPYLRAITLNGLAGLVLGWLYWYRGLESAIVAHMAADFTIYLGFANFL